MHRLLENTESTEGGRQRERKRKKGISAAPLGVIFILNAIRRSEH